VGQLIDRKNAAIGLGHETVAEGLWIVEVETVGHFDGIDLSDEVRHGRIGRGQLLGETLTAMDPTDRCLVTLIAHEIYREGRDRTEGIVANVRSRDNGQPLVKQFNQRANYSSLGLPALTQQYDVVSGQERRLELGQDGVFISQNGRGEWHARGEANF